jgi:molecular chaperone HscB
MRSLPNSYFELFRLPQRFMIDMSALESAYRTVQTQVHPDRYAGAGEVQKRVALQWAAHANQAFHTLRKPLRRAVYLLYLNGVDVQTENNTAMAPDFLLQQMEWREAIEEAAATGDRTALNAFLTRLRQEQETRYHELEIQFDNGALQPAAEIVRQLMFIEKLEKEALRQIDALTEPLC